MVAPKKNQFAAKDLGTHLTARAVIMLAPQEMAQVKAQAKSAGMSVSAWGRHKFGLR